MKTFLADRLRASLRLQILKLLGALESRRIDDGTLASALRDLDRETARDVLLSELRWMERQALIRIEEQLDSLSIILTERGDLAQRGVTAEPGVARPSDT